NNNGTPDDEEAFTVLYKKGEHGAFTEDVADKTKFEDQSAGADTPAYAGETDAAKGGKPQGEENWVFVGWNEKDGDVAATVSGADADADSVITYIAVWAIDNNNNGIPDEDEDFPITYPDADKDDDGDGKPDEVTEEVPYGTKIQVDPNGGTWKGSPEVQTFTITGEFNDLKEEPTRTDYAFVGWKKTDGTDGVKYVFTAQWKDDKNHNNIPDEDEDFPITYPDADKDDDGDGKPDEVTEEVPYGTKIQVDPNGGTWKGSTEVQTFTITGEFNDLKEEPTRTDYVFAGWKKTDGTDGVKYVFTAQWKDDKNNNGIPDEDEEFVITFLPNGGTIGGSTDPVVVNAKYGEVITIIDAPERDGYTFLLWRGSEYQPGDTYEVTEDHTFTAEWEKKDPVAPPKTGDDSSWFFWILLMAASLLAMAGAVFGRRRRDMSR
ncbi:MAG: InlB B-repeat-containing protein, partial [Lachnospiraceae bacterium]|nr:InlB B-repeat-containing protein [Lachnospiraceae bacterium]